MITVQRIQMMGSGGRWDKLVCLEHDGVVKFGVLGELLAWKKNMQTLQNKQKPFKSRENKVENAAISNYLLPFESFT